MWSASRPCPQASWKRMPPLPPASTIGHLARRRGAGRQLGQRPRRRDLGDVLDAVALEDLVALGAGERLVAGLHPGVAVGDADDVEARADLLVLGEQAVGVGDEDAAPAVAAADLHLGDGVAGGAGGVVGPGQQLELARLVHRVRCGAVAPAVGRRRARARRCAPRRRPGGRRRRRRGPRPAGPPRSGRRCGRSRSSRRRRPGSRRPRERPEESSSTRRSSSRALPVAASSANTSAMSPPPTKAAESTRSSTSGSMRAVSVTAVS